MVCRHIAVTLMSCLCGSAGCGLAAAVAAVPRALLHCHEGEHGGWGKCVLHMAQGMYVCGHMRFSLLKAESVAATRWRLG
jgi:hypothetical protein